MASVGMSVSLDHCIGLLCGGNGETLRKNIHDINIANK